jgi:streptogramin lyase
VNTLSKMWRVIATAVVACCVMAVGVGPAGATGDTITEFNLSHTSGPTNIVVGADGNLWFVDGGSTPAIGRITPSGVITEFSAGLNPGSSPGDIVLGPDGNVWFDDQGTTPAIGQITPGGVITEFSNGLGTPSEPVGVIAGPDGNLWFIDESNQGRQEAIGRITPGGVITEFSNGLSNETGGFTADGDPTSLAAGPDGNLWFTEPDAIGQITTAGAVKLFNDTTPAPGTNVTNHIAVGSDGNLWFTNDFTNGSGPGTPGIGRITTSGAITVFTAGLRPSSLPLGLIRGPDGNLWFLDGSTPAAIGQITPSGTISEFSTGLRSSSFLPSLVSGPDGNLWFTDAAGAIGQITPSGVITEFSNGLNTASFPDQIVTGPDKNLWFTDPGVGSNKTPAIGRLELNGGGGGATPAITGVHQSHSVWREGHGLATISKQTKHRAPVGTTFSFTLNVQATVSFTFTRKVKGRKVDGKCVARTKKNRKKRGCQLIVTSGQLSFTGQAGSNQVSFQGHITRTQKLRPGRYTLVLTATASGQTSSSRKLRFKILTQ